MRSVSIWASALVLVGVLGCSSQSAEDDETDDALTATEASTELAKIVARPEASLRGVGDPVLRVQGAQELWSFYPFHADTTLKTAKSVADDTESAFLVVGSSGAMLLVDVATGAGAASVPADTTTQEVAARLQADLHAMNASTGTIHTNGLPGEGVVDELTTKLTSATERIAAKLVEGGYVARAIAATKERASRVVGYFKGREQTSAHTAAVTAATPDPTPTPTTSTPDTTTTGAKPTTTTAKLLKGPAAVAVAVEKLVDRAVHAVEGHASTASPKAEDQGVPIESVTTDPDESFKVRRSSDADVLKSKTSAEVAITAQDATSLVDKHPESVWTPGSDPAEVAPLWKDRTPHAEFVVAEDIAKESLQKLKDAGHKAIWVVRAETVKAIKEAKEDLPIHKDEAVAETRSDGATRAVLSAAKTYLVKGWDAAVLQMSDEDFMKSPIFQAIDALVTRSLAGDPLPKIDLVGDGVPEDLLAATIKRAKDLLHKVGVDVADIIRPAIHGATPSKPAPPPTKPPTTPDPTPTPAPTPAPSTNVDPSSSWDAGSSAPLPNDSDPVLLAPSQKPDAGASKHAAKPAADGGCSVGGHASGSDVGGMFALGLAALSLRRRRPLTAPR